jgi:hypothetical protein
MKNPLLLLLAGSLLLAACAGSAMHRDCLEKQKQVERTAALAAIEMRLGLTDQEVRALLGEPNEIITVRGTGGLENWKYYLRPGCQTYLEVTAPVTELFFLDRHLVKWLIYVK